jgi:hypothetical protein
MSRPAVASPNRRSDNLRPASFEMGRGCIAATGKPMNDERHRTVNGGCFI